MLANPVGPAALRMVTHYDVSRGDCEAALGAAAEVVGAG